MHNNICFGASIYSTGTHHRVILNRVTYFVPWAHTGKGKEWPKLTQLKRRKRIWKKMKVNGPARSKPGQVKNSWQWAKHVWLYSDLLQL